MPQNTNLGSSGARLKKKTKKGKVLFAFGLEKNPLGLQ